MKSYWLSGSKVNSSKSVIENLVPGAQYQVVMYLRKGPLIGPPSDPVTFAIGKLPGTRIMTLPKCYLLGCNVQAQLIILIYGRPILVHPISYPQSNKLLQLYSWRASLAFTIWSGGWESEANMFSMIISKEQKPWLLSRRWKPLL